MGKGIERLDADKKKKETQILEMDFYKLLNPGAAAAAPMPSLEADAPPPHHLRCLCRSQSLRRRACQT